MTQSSANIVLLGALEQPQATHTGMKWNSVTEDYAKEHGSVNQPHEVLWSIRVGFWLCVCNPSWMATDQRKLLDSVGNELAWGNGRSSLETRLKLLFIISTISTSDGQRCAYRPVSPDQNEHPGLPYWTASKFSWMSLFLSAPIACGSEEDMVLSGESKEFDIVIVDKCWGIGLRLQGGMVIASLLEDFRCGFAVVGTVQRGEQMASYWCTYPTHSALSKYLALQVDKVLANSCHARSKY